MIVDNLPIPRTGTLSPFERAVDWIFLREAIFIELGPNRRAKTTVWKIKVSDSQLICNIQTN